MVNKPKRYDRVFWIEVEKIKPNPMQPRREFDESRLASLTDSIRQYGVLQPLVVSRIEKDTESGISVHYELIAGERRWRASRGAGLVQVPVVIKDDQGEKIKLELAIIENLQREDLNAIDRAFAFKKLVEEFNLRHHEVGKKVGKSREYVSNTIRLLNLPDEIQRALVARKITEGHCRPILMVSERPEAQLGFFKKIVEQRMTVRTAEKMSRVMASERARKPVLSSDPETAKLEKSLSELLGGIVKIDKDMDRGRVSIDFISSQKMLAFIERLRMEQGLAPGGVSEAEEVVSISGMETTPEVFERDQAVKIRDIVEDIVEGESTSGDTALQSQVDDLISDSVVDSVGNEDGILVDSIDKTSKEEDGLSGFDEDLPLQEGEETKEKEVDEDLSRQSKTKLEEDEPFWKHFL